ncbi:hypothetical protein [Anaerosalibacter sp. Marseille-P3206]|uniref:hypothetical protein n=1 Tax=Anaerosalibacter sp. Marseille-P3206 TaxID=1871005 RepID=UPI0009861107|nr:hypothetical protein [Anaerosalibacter sp. Marseille-P3206]
MKTWEIMQHTGKRFKRKSDGLTIAITEDGTLNWESGYMNLNTNDDWKEVKEPVTFMEVLEKAKEDNTTRIHMENKKRNIVENSTLGTLMYRLIADYNSQHVAEILLTSEFYIE